MEVSYGEGIASHTGPESCVAVREGSGEALTGVGAGRAKEPRKGLIRDADALPECGRPHRIRRYREADSSPARWKTPHMHGNTSHFSPGDPVLGQAGDGGSGPRCESERSTTSMHEHGKSDKPIVPKKSANKGVPAARAAPAEPMEGRGPSQGQFGSANQDPDAETDIGPATSAGPDTRSGRIGQGGEVHIALAPRV